jgi:TonB-linked SusC/RagA family outer membrane protein
MKKRLEKKISIDIKYIMKMGFLSLLAGLMSLPMDAQQGIRVSGSVTDNSGELLSAVNITVKGAPMVGSMTDDQGEYSITVPSDTITLIFSSVGYETQEVKVGSRRIIAVSLSEEALALDEVTVVAFGTQKKESVIASVTTIKPSELKVPSSNLTTAFAGRIAGLISYQRTGEPGMDNADFFIRGVTTFGTGKRDPLILIDGVEMTKDDLARLTTDDIGSFSIMKDANATALYGARGANGVILVTTKEGREGKATVQFRMEGSYSAPTQTMEYADVVSYMTLHNEAINTRTPINPPRYTTEKIFNTAKADRDPIRYPANNWQEQLFNDYTFNQRYNLNVNGGGKIARYYIAAAYSRDNGIIKMDQRNNFNSNIQIDRYVLRSNINVDLTSTTEAIVRLNGSFDDYSGPLDGGTDLYNKALNSNPALFPAYYPPDAATQNIKHILFGNYGDGSYLNPYADMVKGYKTSDRTNMLAQFELKQNLDFIVEGLSARGLFNVNRYSLLEFKNSYTPFFYQLDETSEDYKLIALNPNDGDAAVKQLDGGSYRELLNTMYFEGSVQYNHQFNKKHDVSGMLVYTLRESLNGNATSLQSALPHRNIGLAGRLTYGYDSRYFFETNFGYNGSERFAENERFGFFPSIGGGWIASNEKFLEPYKKVLSKLKFKATYGLVGNDQIGSDDDRFFYLSEVVDDNGDRGYTFGYRYSGASHSGVAISRYSDPLITWEISRKTNLGLELNLWNSLELQVDWFRENRSKILQKRADIPVTLGLQAQPSANIGKANGSGIDVSLDYSKSFNKDFWTVIRGNFTYATSKYVVYEEPDYGLTPWRSHKGQKIAQEWGFVAERLFTDDEEVKYTPKQFGEYGAGDIKYKDINGDMLIDDSDLVPIGYPTTPEIIYGFGLSFGYKNIDFSAFFQGSARSAFWIDAGATAPFIGERALLKYYADDHWSEDNRNIYALWPRLSEYEIENNQLTDGRKSTWFMRDGTFLRFKTAEIGYTLPKRWVENIKLHNARVYVSGTNLLVFSRFKMWDPEMAGNGLAYPLQRVINIGINVEF